MGPRTQQWQHGSRNHTPNPDAGDSFWKHAPGKLQKCQPSNSPRARNGLQKYRHLSPTITHSNRSTCLRSQLFANTSNLHIPTNPALTQPTSNLIRDPLVDKSNFIYPTGASPNLKAYLYVIVVMYFKAFNTKLQLPPNPALTQPISLLDKK